MPTVPEDVLPSASHRNSQVTMSPVMRQSSHASEPSLTNNTILVTSRKPNCDSIVVEREEDKLDDFDLGYKQNYLSFAMVTLALSLSVFLFALDNTILSTAIPQITQEFDSLDDIGWYGSAYTLTLCAFQLTYGKLYTLFRTKYVFLVAVVIFNAGSMICGAAASSAVLIIGRAVAGIGCAGLYSGVLVIISHTVSVRYQPLYTSCIGAMYGIAFVVGPLLGGLLADKVSWRWCFYINLPIGAFTIGSIVLCLRSPKPKQETTPSTCAEYLKKFDVPGIITLIPAIICLLLALQRGTTVSSWSDARVIVLFVLFGIFTLCFVLTQWKGGSEVTLPPRIIANRSILCASIFAMCVTGALVVAISYLPLLYQAINEESATESAISIMPLIVSNIVATIAAGVLISACGYCNPTLILSAIFIAVGGGLLTTTIDRESALIISKAKQVGYQIIFGFGVGMGLQSPLIVGQNVLSKADIPTGSAVIVFSQALGSTIFLSTGQSVFTKSLIAGLQNLSLNQEAIQAVLQSASAFRNILDGNLVAAVALKYGSAVCEVFFVAVGLASISVVAVAFIQWKKIGAGQRDTNRNGEVTKESA